MHNEFGHIAKQCPTLSSFKQNNASTKVCFHCWKPGHLGCNCFTNSLKQGNNNFSKDPDQNTSNRQSQMLYHCGKQGHISKFCHTKFEMTQTETANQNQGNCDKSIIICYFTGK